MSDDPKVIDGKEIAKKVRADLKIKVEDFVKRYNKPPGLSVVLIGENPASQIYVNMKEKACKKAGITSVKHVLPAERARFLFHPTVGEALLIRLV